MRCVGIHGNRVGAGGCIWVDWYVCSCTLAAFVSSLWQVGQPVQIEVIEHLGKTTAVCTLQKDMSLHSPTWIACPFVHCLWAVMAFFRFPYVPAAILSISLASALNYYLSRQRCWALYAFLSQLSCEKPSNIFSAVSSGIPDCSMACLKS